MTEPQPEPMQKPPERKHVVDIKILADDWKGVLETLRHIAWYLESEGPGRNCVSGGPDVGFTLVDKINPDMTHDRYIEELHAWLRANRKKEKTYDRATSD